MTDSLKKGMVYAFKTKPYSQYAVADTGRFAVFHVLDSIGKQPDSIVVSILDCVFDRKPRLEDLKNCRIMERVETEYFKLPFSGLKELVLNVWLEDWDFDEIHCLGELDLTNEENDLAKRSSTYCWWGGVSRNVELAWRCRHDKVAFEAELLLLRTDMRRAQEIRKQRIRERLRGITLDSLAGESQFRKWDKRAEFIPQVFLESIRNRSQGMLREFLHLGPKIKKSEARRILKSFVFWVNKENERHGSDVIETDEREDLHEFLEEVCWAVKQQSLLDEVEGWRNW